jgi:hypothetical protein
VDLVEGWERGRYVVVAWLLEVSLFGSLHCTRYCYWYFEEGTRPRAEEGYLGGERWVVVSYRRKVRIARGRKRPLVSLGTVQGGRCLFREGGVPGCEASSLAV